MRSVRPGDTVFKFKALLTRQISRKSTDDRAEISKIATDDAERNGLSAGRLEVGYVRNVLGNGLDPEGVKERGTENVRPCSHDFIVTGSVRDSLARSKVRDLPIFRSAKGPRIYFGLGKSAQGDTVVRIGLPIDVNHAVIPSVAVRKDAALIRNAELIPGCTDQPVHGRTVDRSQSLRKVGRESRARLRAAEGCGRERVNVRYLCCRQGRELRVVLEINVGLECGLETFVGDEEEELVLDYRSAKVATKVSILIEQAIAPGTKRLEVLTGIRVVVAVSGEAAP